MMYVIYPLIIVWLFCVSCIFDWMSVTMFCIGFLLWNVLEYCFHRFAFHNRKIPRKIRRWLTNGHIVHHRFPNRKENLALPIALTLPVSLIGLGITYLATGITYLNWFYSGLILGLYSYEMMHYAAHHWNLNNAWFRYMKQHHLSHHYKTPNSKFMVSNPLLDFLFRTK